MKKEQMQQFKDILANYVTLKKYQEAEKLIAKYEIKYPEIASKDASVFLIKAKIYTARVEYDRAIATLEDGLNIDVKNEELLFALANLLENKSEYKEAIEVYKKFAYHCEKIVDKLNVAKKIAELEKKILLEQISNRDSNKRKNLIVFHLESLSNEIYNENKHLFPTLNHLISKSVYLKNYYSSATSTYMAMTDFIYGNDFELDDSIFFDALCSPKQNATNIYELLGERGYKTLGIRYTKPWLDQVARSNLWGDKEEYTWRDNYGDFIGKIRSTIENKESAPFAMYIWDARGHISIHDEQKLKGHNFFERRQLGYRCMDETIKDVLELLKENDLLNDTIIVGFGDHGDELWTHAFNGGMCHGTEPHTNMIATPAFIYDAELESVEFPDLVSTIDLKNTLLSLLHEKEESHYKYSGINIFSKQNQFVFSKNLFANQGEGFGRTKLNKSYGIKNDNYNLIVSKYGLELYAYRVDSGNQSNLLSFFQMKKDGSLIFDDKGATHAHFKNIMSPDQIIDIVANYHELSHELMKRVEIKNKSIESKKTFYFDTKYFKKIRGKEYYWSANSFYLKSECKSDCYGCRACEQICPKNCIGMVDDEEGFSYPVKDEKLCIDCDLCEKVCPNINKDELDGSIDTSEAYMAIHKDEDLLYQSASGGVFSAIAESFCKENFVVFGVEFDENLNAVHSYTTSLSKIGKYRKSKYLQSDSGTCYRSVKQFLNDGKKVLFTGTPCQIAGLRLFLRKDYENLLCADFVCRGVPSQKIFNFYRDSLENKFKGKVTSFSFKHKTYSEDQGWNARNVKYQIDNNETVVTSVIQDPYLKGYHSSLFNKPSCYECKYANPKRISDITMADFWGVENLYPDKEVHKGVSVFLANTQKGKDLVQEMSKLMELQKVDPSFVIKNNIQLRQPTKINPKREQFYEKIKSQKFDEVVNELIPAPSFGKNNTVIWQK